MDCSPIAWSPPPYDEYDDTCTSPDIGQCGIDTSEVNEDEEDTEAEVPIYSKQPISLEASNITIMHYKMRHNLTDQAVSDLLALLSLHCSSSNTYSSSLHHLKKNFDHFPTIINHYYCSACFQSADESTKTCTNALCGRDLSCLEGRSSFIEVPIEMQLKSLFKRKIIDMHIYVYLNNTFYLQV